MSEDTFSWDAPFTAEDFQNISGIFCSIHTASKANEAFQRILKERGVKVYRDEITRPTEPTYWHNEKSQWDSHGAILIDIKPLKEG